MGFKLTVILCLIIFGAMYFAPPAPDMPDRDRVATAPEPAPAPVAPEPPAETAQVPVQPQPQEPGPDLSADTDAAVSAALAEAAESVSESDVPEGEAEAENTPLNLGTLSLDSDGATSLSLADSVRERADAAREAAGGGLLRPQTGQPPLLPDASAGNGDAGQFARVTGSAVNLRAGPSTGDAVVGRVSLGQRVEVLEQVGTAWSAIRDPGSGGIAYISSQFLDPVQ